MDEPLHSLGLHRGIEYRYNSAIRERERQVPPRSRFSLARPIFGQNQRIPTRLPDIQRVKLLLVCNSRATLS